VLYLLVFTQNVVITKNKIHLVYAYRFIFFVVVTFHFSRTVLH